MAAAKYPLYKVLIWRYVRVFLAAFIPVVVVDQVFYGNPDVVKSLLLAGLAAGLVALGKALREGQEYDSLVHRLPV